MTPTMGSDTTTPTMGSDTTTLAMGSDTTTRTMGSDTTTLNMGSDTMIRMVALRTQRHFGVMNSVAIRRIAVYCGSSPGSDRRFLSNAHALGHALAVRGIGVVYGGAAVGCMGAVADGALTAGGEVLGVLTRGLAAREIAHPRLTSLELVETMHERKARMAALSDAVIVLPGGYGTFDELFEALTWSQLRIDHKPIGLLDDQGFWQPLLAFLDTAVTAGFLQAQNRALLSHAPDVDTLLTQLSAVYATTATTVASAIQP